MFGRKGEKNVRALVDEVDEKLRRQCWSETSRFGWKDEKMGVGWLAMLEERKCRIFGRAVGDLEASVYHASLARVP